MYDLSEKIPAILNAPETTVYIVSLNGDDDIRKQFSLRLNQSEKSKLNTKNVYSQVHFIERVRRRGVILR